VYYCPDDFSTSARRIEAGEGALLQTGLRFEVPHGYMLEVKNRSSIAANRNLIVGACVIDSGYAGEVFINLHNVGNDTQMIEKGTKIAQLVMVPVVSFQAWENEDGELYEYPVTISARGDGALGSTDAS
jgi:dUTP pyrophosphatase